jgi:hypothetical protein
VALKVISGDNVDAVNRLPPMGMVIYKAYTNVQLEAMSNMNSMARRSKAICSRGQLIETQAHRGVKTRGKYVAMVATA